MIGPKLRAVAIVATVMLSSNALAECGSDRCVDVQITKVNIDGNGDSWLSTSGNEGLLSCTPDSGFWLKLDPTLAHAGLLTSAALSFFLTHQKATVTVSTTGVCSVRYIVADAQ